MRDSIWNTTRRCCIVHAHFVCTHINPTCMFIDKIVLETLRWKLHHLVHIVQRTIWMSRTKVLMVTRRHCISTHLVTSTDVVTHLHLTLAALLIKILHLTIICGIIILAVVMMRRGIVTVGMPIEGVVGCIVLIGKGRITGRRDGRGWRRNHAAGVAAQGR